MCTEMLVSETISFLCLIIQAYWGGGICFYRNWESCETMVGLTMDEREPPIISATTPRSLCDSTIKVLVHA